MTIDVSLWVSLKGVDLVARTAYLTLVDKMGFGDQLLALRRLDFYGFRIESDGPAETIARLKRLAAVRTIFYNRNKHNHFLDAGWEGGHESEGMPPDEIRRRLTVEAAGAAQTAPPKNDSQTERDRVILQSVPVYRTEFRVEDLGDSARNALARRLESELSTAPVDVWALGTCWFLALRARSGDEARTLTEELAVTLDRDHGLLLNPNNQRYEFLHVEKLDLRKK